MLQVSLYIAEHRLELEEEGGKDKAQVAVEEHLYFFIFFCFLYRRLAWPVGKD